MRYLLAALGAIALLLGAAVWTAPTWVGWLIVRVAPDFGVTGVRLKLTHLRLEGARAEQLALVYGDTQLEAAAVDVRYTLSGLWAGQIERADFESLSLTLAVEVDAADGSEPVAATQPVEILGALAGIPDLSAPAMRLSVPGMDFIAHGDVRLVAGVVEFAMRGEAPELAAHMRLDGRISPAGEVALTLADTRAAKPFVQVASQVGADAIQVSAEYDLQGYPLELLMRVAGAPPGSGHITGSLQGELPWPVEDWMSLPVQGRLQADWRDAAGTLALENLRARFEGNSADLALMFDRGTVRLPESAVRITLDGARIKYGTGAVTLGAGVLPFEVALEDASLKGELGRLAVALTDPFAVTFGGPVTYRSPDLASRAQVSGKGTVSDTAAGLDLNLDYGDLRLPFRVDADLSGSSVVVTVRGDHAVTARNPVLATLLMDWQETYDLTTAEIHYVLDLIWKDDALSGRVDLKLSEAVAIWEGDRFSGVQGAFKFVLDNDDIRLEPSPLQVGEADLGVVVSDIRTRVGWQDPLVRVEQTTFRTLGGQGTVSDFTYDLEQETARFDVRVNGLDLAQVVALEGEHISATGQLSGTLPVNVRGGAASIRGGQVSAESGGVVRLAPSLANLTGQPGLDFATQALTDFRYDKLVTRADFEENGDLALAVSLQGRNPTVEKGRAIHYNLNISENVYALLDSLRAQRSVTDKVAARALGDKSSQSRDQQKQQKQNTQPKD